MENFAVDIVIPWVDSSSEKWRENFEFYKSLEEVNVGEEGFRSSPKLLNLWLIGASKYASWARKIFIVVDRLTDLSGLNVQDEKIEIVYHDQFIPIEFLPTFNSNVIECFVYLIPNLAERFVLFNDDCYLTNQTTQEDFFTPHGKAIDSDQVYPVGASEVYSHTIVNNLIFINDQIDYKKYQNKFLKRRIFSILNLRTLRTLLFNEMLSSFHGWQDEHVPVAYTKTMFRQTFGEHTYLHQRLLNGSRFRSFTDVSHLLVRFWRLARFDYAPRPFRSLGVYTEMQPGLEQSNLKRILEKNKKIICVNDVAMSNEDARQSYISLTRILTEFYGRDL
ncbi:hypothetical protein [Weissella cibaria]|uniref:hypothetical protein n=1 Tax=Weissella cibaria TaxID=137591 RepID=UPI0013DA96B2|nr:hypothetical protein [Weissella cibaria]NFA02560.1 hypothetical protein [Weissella cibaria]